VNYKNAYVYNKNTSEYEKAYIYSDINSIYIDENETITLADKISTINLNSEILWKNKNTGEPIYSSVITKTLSTGVKALIYTSWDWYIYCRNANTGELIWRYATGGVCYGRCQAEDVNNDGKIEIFGASHDGNVYCLDESGNKLWSFKNLYDREGTGTISSAGSYYLTDTTKNWVTNSFQRGTQGLNASVSITSGTGSGQTLEISSVESNKLWFYDNWTTVPDSTSKYKIIPRYTSDINYQHAGTLIEEDTVYYLYVTGFDGQLVKIKASDGRLIWKYSVKESIEPYPTILDINNDGEYEVLISCLDKHVYCLKADDGSVVWSTAMNEGCDAFINVKDIDNDGTLEVLISCRDNRVYVLNGSTGAIESYTRDTGGDIDNRPFTHPSLDGFVCGSDSGFIYGYDSNCECLWGYKANDSTNTSMVGSVLNSNLILIQGDQSGALHFLDKDGKPIKVMYLRGGIEGTPYVEIGNGFFILYVTTIEGWVYAIKISN
jgi:outer membrane protein assembly factor BamB